MAAKYYGGNGKKSSPPVGSLSAKATNVGGVPQVSSLGGGTGVSPTSSPVASRMAEREAIFAKPTATQVLGQAPTVIPFQTVKGVTQTIVPVTQVKPIITLSPAFAGKAAASVQGGVIIEKTPILKQQGDIFRPFGSPVGVARLPYGAPQQVPSSSQFYGDNIFLAGYQPPPKKELFPKPPPVPETPSEIQVFTEARGRVSRKKIGPVQLKIASRQLEEQTKQTANIQRTLDELLKVENPSFRQKIQINLLRSRLVIDENIQTIGTNVFVAALPAAFVTKEAVIGAEAVAETVAVREAGAVVKVARVTEGVVAKETVAEAVKRIAPVAVERAAPVVTRKIVQEGAVGIVPKAGAPKVLGFLGRVPQAIGEVGVGQAGLRLTVKQIEKAYGTDIVKGAQESSALVFAGRGEDLYERDAQGRAIGLKQVQAGLVSKKGAGETVSDFLKYSFVGSLPAGQQALRTFSPTFRAEEERAIKDVGRSRGLSGAELDAFVIQVKRAGNRLQAAEALTTLFTVERTTERLGSKAIAKIFAKREGVQLTRKETARKLFGLTAPTFAIAGAIEGAAQYATQLQTRGGEASVVGALQAVGGGAVISTVLGGGGVAFSATRPTVSKVFTGVGQALEFPFEAGGDILAAGQKTIIKGLGGEVIEPAIKPVFRKGVKSASQEAAEKFELLVLGRKPSVKGVKPRVTTPSFGGGQAPSLQFGVGTPSEVQAQVQTSAENIANTLNIGVPVTTKVQPVKPRTPIPITERIKTNGEVVVKTPIEALVETPTTVTTPVEALANVGIPVQTNVFGLRGFIPPPLPFPMGEGGGTARASAKTFRNELLASRELFKQQISFGIKNLQQPVGKKPMKVKQKKTVRQNDRSLIARQLSFGLQNLGNRRGRM